MRRFRNSLAAVAVLLVSSAFPALAEEPVETALKAWVTAIDATPDWRAAYTALMIDPRTGRATLSGLAVASETPGFNLTLRTVTVDGFEPTADGTFAAATIEIIGADLQAGIFAVTIPGATINAPVFPTANGFVWDAARPFATVVQALAPLARVKMAGASAGSIAVTETLGNVVTRTTYGAVKLSGWENGKIASMAAGPLRTDSPVENPLVTLSAQSAETQGIDLNAFAAVYDPARYVGGVGDGVWRTAVAHAVYRTVALSQAGATITMGGAVLDNFGVRQSKTPPRDTVPGEAPTGAAAFAAQFDRLSIYGIGRFALRDFNLALTERDKLHIGGFSVTGVSTDAIGSFVIDDLLASVGSQGSLKVALLTFGGVSMPSMDTIKAAAAAYDAGGDIDYSSLAPALSFAEAAGVDVAIAALPAVKLGRLRLDLGNYAGKVPTTVTAALAGADLPAALIPSDRIARLLADVGYDRVRIDGGGKIDWAASGDITVRDFRLAMKDAAEISGEADLTGLTPAEAEHMDNPKAALAKLALKRMTLTITEDSVVGRVIGAQAARLKVDQVKFREQFANGLPFMLTFLGDRTLQTQLAPVLQAFIKTEGGTITATATPSAPVPLSALLSAAQTAPFSLFGLLSPAITGTPGQAPPPAPTPPPTPDIRGTATPAD